MGEPPGKTRGESLHTPVSQQRSWALDQFREEHGKEAQTGASELPLPPHCYLPGTEKPSLWQEVGSVVNSSHPKLLTPKGSPGANT